MFAHHVLTSAAIISIAAGCPLSVVHQLTELNTRSLNTYSTTSSDSASSLLLTIPDDTVSDPLKGVSTGSQKSSGSSSEGPSPTTPNSKVAEIDHQAANKTDAVDQPSSDIAVPSGGEKCPRPAMPNKPSSPASSITKPKRIAFYAWSAIGLWALIA